jgi:hypothetical protein
VLELLRLPGDPSALERVSRLLVAKDDTGAAFAEDTFAEQGIDCLTDLCLEDGARPVAP